MPRGRPLRQAGLVLLLAFVAASLCCFFHRKNGLVSSSHILEHRPGRGIATTAVAPGESYVDGMGIRRNYGEDHPRGLRTAGVPGEGLQLAAANSGTGVASERSRKYRHKPFLPLSNMDILALILVSLGLMIAAAGGIGGGGILVPIFVLVLQFSAKYAVPLSNITIFGGAITNTCFNLKKRHPLADRPLVDWDVILVMEPITIGGSLAGTYIQKIMPEVVLTLMMVVLLVATADRMFRKGIKLFMKESNQQTMTPKDNNLADDAKEERLEGETARLLGDGFNDDQPVHVPNPDTQASLMKMLEEERHTAVGKVLIISAVFSVMLAVNLLKGGGALISPLGIVCGSFAFWAISVLSLVFLVLVSARVRQYLIARWRLKSRLGYKYVAGDIQWTPMTTLVYPPICFFAGFVAGMFGVGGGIVKGPLMLEMGVHPMVASSTSAVMILFTSFTATTSFFAFGLLEMDYAVPYFFLGLVATAVGQAGTDYLVKRFKRPSLIILSIASLIGLSAILMGIDGVSDLVSSAGNGIATGGGFCSAD